MMDLMPSSLVRFRFPPLWDDDEDWGLVNTSMPGGLSIAEDEAHVYIEAAVPGVDPKEIEVVVDKGVVWIKGETKAEETKKKYYRKAMSSFSYRVAVPGDIDQKAEPEATCKNGVMTVTFRKTPSSQPKKIAVKA